MIFIYLLVALGYFLGIVEKKDDWNFAHVIAALLWPIAAGYLFGLYAWNCTSKDG